MRADRDESALFPIIETSLVGDSEGQTALPEIGVIGAEQRGPLPSLRLDVAHDLQLGAVAEVRELARQNPFVLAGIQFMEEAEHGFGLGIGAGVGGSGLSGGHASEPATGDEQQRENGLHGLQMTFAELAAFSSSIFMIAN